MTKPLDRQSRFAFIVLSCFLERWLSRGYYRRRDRIAEPAPVTTADDG